MKIYVVGGSKNTFRPLDRIREKFLVDKQHEGDNIDSLNPWYCELTGLYYLWKNCDDDIVGLEHYRRYFVNAKGGILSESEIRKLLLKYDVITCHYKNPNSIFASYKRHHFGTDEFFYLFQTFKHQNEIKRYLCSNDFIVFNMFICKKSIIDQYCSWFFNNLFDLKLDYTKIKKRMVGYLSEYLFGAWLTDNGYNTFHSKYVVIK